MRESLYTLDGWVDGKLLVFSRAPVVIAIGGRGIGKTFNVIRELILANEPFIYLRRSQNQIDACKVQELSPFTPIANHLGISINSRPLSKHISGFYKDSGEEQLLVSIGIALSTFANVRGFDASKYGVLLFDEFISEKHERPIRHEGEAFLNVIETINRNRELTSGKPLKVILLSNANKFDNPILSAIGAIKPLDKMIRQNKERSMFYDGDLEIFRYSDSPISQKKRDTLLYRLSQSKDFNSMSLDNSFSEETYLNVQSKPIQEYVPVASIRNITVYRHKTKSEYYVVHGEKSTNVYANTPEQTREFCRKTFRAQEAFCKGQVYFSTAECKAIFSSIWG